MIKKPPECYSCPFYRMSDYYVPDQYVEGSTVLVMGQNPGEQEELEGRPFVGNTGKLMDETYLPLASRSREQVSVGNAIRCRLKGTNQLPPLKLKSTQEAIEHCHKAYFKLPFGTKLIITQGEYALYAMTQEGLEEYNKLGDWRGFLLPYEPIGTNKVPLLICYDPISSFVSVYATYHLAFTFENPIAKFVTQQDWSKVGRILSGKWPKPLPQIHEGIPILWPANAAFDTEFDPSNKHFLCYSLYDGKYLYWSDKLKTNQTNMFRTVMHNTSNDTPFLSGKPNLIMHNANADIPFANKLFPDGYTYDDTMHAHAVLWSDLDHGLGFLGSIYGSINRWKHLSSLNHVLYSAADALVTWEVWQALSKHLERDPQSKYIYGIQKSLVPIIMQAEDHGIKVNQAKAAEYYKMYDDQVVDLNLQAQTIVGWPINLRSNDQVKHQLYQVEKL